MNRTYIIAAIAVVVLAGGGFFAFKELYVPPAPLSVTSPIVDPAVADAASYTLADIGGHSTEADCWTVVEGKVYNVTQFIGSHPGGRAILKACGKDSTVMFNKEREHRTAGDTLKLFYIGVLKS